MTENLGSESAPCRDGKHLWLEVAFTEAQRKETGHDHYEICGKCNAIRELA